MVLPAFVMMPLVTTRSDMTPTKNITGAPAKTAGARLSDYTEHVPIIITKTQDFITQGWPGSGTELDPFVISGLNITYDLNLMSVNITNTDAYFKIVDCVINQLSSSYDAIYLENTSHATIEYTTITSDGGGINLNNATSTRVLNTDFTINGSGYNAVLMTSSHNVLVQDCVSVAPLGRAVHASDSNNLSVIDVSHTGTTSRWAIRLSNCNSTTIVGFDVDTALTLVDGTNVNDLYVVDSKGTSLVRGVSVDGAFNVTVLNTDISSSQTSFEASGGIVSMITIEGCQLSASADYAIRGTVSTNDTTILNNRIQSSQNGISLQQSYGVTITGNTFEDLSKGNAVVIATGRDVVVSDNTISNVALNDGLVLTNLVNVTVSGNSLSHIDGDAIYTDSLNDTVMVGNTIMDADNGIYCNGAAYRWDITSNVVDSANGVGIYFFGSGDLNASYNTVSDTGAEGIYFDTIIGDLTVVGNDVSYTGDVAIYVSDISAPLVENNTMSHVSEGIFVTQTPNCTVRLNQIWDAVDYGIDTYDIDDGDILNNTIGAGPEVGIYLDGSLDVTVFGNTMTECGIYLDYHSSLSSCILDISHNTVNGLPVYYVLNESGLSINGWFYGQIIVVNSTNILIQNGSFINPTVAVSAYYTDFITIDNLHVESIYYGLIVRGCSNVTITNSQLEGDAAKRGVVLYMSYNVTVTEVHADGWSNQGSGYAFYCYFGEVFTLTNVTITDSTRGLHATGTDNLTATNLVIKDIRYSAIYGSGSTYWEIYESEFMTSQYGILLSGLSTNWIIDNSKFLYMTDDGIHATGSSVNYNNVTNCLFEGNDDGVYLSLGNNWAFIGNAFRWNTKHGLYLTAVSGPIIYSNTFVGNMVENGFDNHLPANSWDDGVSVGNAWDDYSGSGVYNVGGSAGAVDHYPTKYLPTSPIVSTPPDVSYAEGTEHYSLTWYAYDDYIFSWNVTMDGVLYDWSAWNFDNVTIDIGGLTYGDYSFEVSIYDADGNNVRDTVLVHVYDATPPDVDGLNTALGFVGGSNQYLIWNVSDMHPANYSVYVDDILTASGDWSTGTISFDISGLTAGDHDVLLEVRDIDLNQATDYVLVRMISDTTSPTIDSPPDVTIYAGSTSNTIEWTPSDLYPGSYEIALNGSTMTSGEWNGEKIVLNIDGLDVGVYQFAITVYDLAGNSASDSVTVTVIQAPWTTATTTTTTTTPPPFDATLAIAVLAGAAGVAVVIVVLYFLKKRKV